MSPKVRVVVPLYDGASTIVEQLDALAAQRFSEPFEVVVVDDGSSDNGPALAKAHPLPNLRLIDSGWETGQARARNAGVHAEGEVDLLLFCDQDDVVDHGWVAGMVEALAQYDLVGGCFDLDRLNDEPQRHWRRPPGIEDGRFAFAPACNLGIWRSVFEAIGGFHLTHPSLGGDDVDLSWRARLAGYSLGHADALVHYRVRSTLRELARQYFGYGRATEIVHRRFPELHPPPLPPWWRELGWLTLRAHLLLSRRTAGQWVARGAEWIGRMVEQRRGHAKSLRS
jgi:GT2 family glycosyltransferase